MVEDPQIEKLKAQMRAYAVCFFIGWITMVFLLGFVLDQTLNVQQQVEQGMRNVISAYQINSN